MCKILRFRIIILCSIITFAVSACTESYDNPPSGLAESDLIGSWVANYSETRSERLILMADGTYTQIYTDSRDSYRYENTGNLWWLELFSNGNVYIHLEDGRYYLAGETIAELYGRNEPCPPDFPNCLWNNQPRIFYDPYANESIEMVDELLLTIRIDQNENIIFHHMWTSSDRGFAIIGGQSELFRMVDTNLNDDR